MPSTHLHFRSPKFHRNANSEVSLPTLKTVFCVLTFTNPTAVRSGELNRSRQLEITEPISLINVKNEPDSVEDSSSDYDIAEIIEKPSKKRRRVEEPTTSAVREVQAKKRFLPEPDTVWDDYEKMLLSCAKKEIRKSIGKVQQISRGKDRSASYIALVQETPFIAVNMCKAVADLALKLRTDIEQARRTIETEIEQSLSRNMREDFESASENGDDDDDGFNVQFKIVNANK
jgi:hypothetical protein